MFLADFYILVTYNDVLAKISYTKYCRFAEVSLLLLLLILYCGEKEHICMLIKAPHLYQGCKNFLMSSLG